MIVNAHDLLGLADGAALHCAGGLPDWWRPYSPLARWLVLRRAPTQDGLLPVGLRGWQRGQRQAAWVDCRALTAIICPEQLAASQPWRRWPATSLAIQALAQLAPRLNAAGLQWGPTGSVGFALASGLPVVRASSDLDVLIRLTAPPDEQQKRCLQQCLADSPVRLDVQIDTGRGGFALREWLAAPGRVLLKTAQGPLLLADPWQQQ
ncbi:malonate decarboxylase holo-ACP synthase [Neisseriaceae bacterium TC5R-5]|nr:malonate decarboxylase holo-ACP synthase [Neisseriaceae bacterium TC5R-5]